MVDFGHGDSSHLPNEGAGVIRAYRIEIVQGKGSTKENLSPIVTCRGDAYAWANVVLCWARWAGLGELLLVVGKCGWGG